MSEHDEQESGGLDRRALIKRTGILTAGVAAWSAPMVSSLASSAYASSSPTPSCQNCGGDQCFDQTACSNTCACAQNVSGQGCSCYDFDAFCDDTNTCASNSDCGTGQVCVLTCCPDGPGVGRCFDACDTTTRVIRRSRGGDGARPFHG